MSYLLTYYNMLCCQQDLTVSRLLRRAGFKLVQCLNGCVLMLINYIKLRNV